MYTKAQFGRFLTNPVVDKLMGLGVVFISLYVLYTFWQQLQLGYFDWFHIALVANQALIVVTTLTRRTAVRVSTNSFFWLVTFFRTFWIFFVLKYVYVHNLPPLVPKYLTTGLLFVSVSFIVYSRLSLGRNIGFLPAKRRLVTTGAYGLVRHPIHSAEFIFFLSYILASYSLLNVSMLMIGVLFVIAKSLVEENFFKDDEEYQAYKKKVPWRWIPQVI